VVVAMVGATGVVAAQGVPIRGRVVDQDGVPLVGVEIEVSSSISPDTMHGLTKKDGKFTIVVPRRSWDYQFRFRYDGYHGVLLPVDPRAVGSNDIEVTLTRYGARLESEIPFTEGRATTLSRSRPDPMTEERRQAMELFAEGIAELETGDTEAAESIFLRATVVDPTYSEPYRALAAIAEATEDWKGAARAARALLRFEPDDLEVKWTIYKSMLRVGTEKKLASAAQDLVSTDRRSVDRIVSNSRDLLDVGDFPRARVLAEVALDFAPENADASFVLGMSCDALGDTAASKPAIERFLGQAPTEHPDIAAATEALEHLK
jgi:tetratricopeptide (TPR) repeat protein